MARAVTPGPTPDAADAPADAAHGVPPDSPPDLSPESLWRRRRSLWLAHAVGLLAVTFVLWSQGLRLYSLHNDFPPAYHPDERGKGYQLVSGERNFNHPQLMLEAALLILPDPTKPPGLDPDAAVRQARVTSAAFGAGTAVLLAWAGYAAAGWAGFLCLGPAVLLCPALLAHAHYFKEDPSLVFGIAAVLCAGAWALRVRSMGPQLWTVIALGVGCGLAASGKYCGLVMLGPALLVGLAATFRRAHWALALASPLVIAVFAAGVCAGVNYRIFSDFDHFIQTFNQEEEHSTTGHAGLTMDRPTRYFDRLVWTEAMPHVKVLAVAALAVLAHAVYRRRAGWTGAAFAVWLAATIVAYSIMLSYSAIPFYRYALPMTVMLYALAGLVAAWLTTLPRRPRVRVACLAGAVALIAVLQGVRCADYTAQFADDSRDALRAWAATLPPGTAVAADNYAALGGDGGPPAPVRLVRTFVPSAPYGGTVDGLRAAGVKYVVTASSTSDRYLDPLIHPDAGRDTVARAVAFYRDLLRYPVVWSRVARHPMWTFANPDIRVYRIDTATPAAER